MERIALSTADRRYWKSQIKCQAACPVGTDARGYVRAIARGDFEQAYLIARGPNPLASLCGRVCGAPCEASCRRGELDKPIAIRALKRFACDRIAPAATSNAKGLIEFIKEAAGRHAQRQCEGQEELLPLLQARTSGTIPALEDKSVGIIGSGPAGLAAAHDLALLGGKVTIYEMEPVLAGMLAVGIPEYRLPRDLIRAEVEAILALGIEAVTNCEVGKDVSLPQLRQRHDAILVCVGAKRSRELPIPGIGSQGVYGGVEFLRDVSIGNPPSLGPRVVVIGGGNVAYDVGRTVLRQIAVDTARAAMRSESVASVHLCSLESLEEMPADDVEIIEGDEEGIIRRNGLGPVKIITDEDGRVHGVEFRKCLSVFDENHRFAPVFDDSATEVIECDSVLIAVGQSADLGFVDSKRDGIELDGRGLIPCDPETGRTSADDIFVAGDLAYGPKLLIHAVASGKKVARSVYAALSGRRIEAADVEVHMALPDYGRELDYERAERASLETAPAAERIAAQDIQVEQGLSELEARREAGRCLDCGVNTIFDGGRCILCGGCVDVCPSLCLRIVGADLIAANGAASLIERQLGGSDPAAGSAIIKDETICIRCGLCAERCPTGAITMERFIFKEVPKCQAA